MNSKIVAYKAFFYGFVLGVFLFFVPPIQVWLIFLKNIFYPSPVNKYLFILIVGLLFGTIMDMSYMVYLKEGKWGLIRLGGFIGVLILLLVILSGGLFGSHVLYF